MDPELVKLLIAVVPSIVTGVATYFGVTRGARFGQQIARETALETAKQSANTQLALSDAEARRNYRSHQIEPFLELAHYRFQAFQRVAFSIEAPWEDEERLALKKQVSDVPNSSFFSAYGVDDPAFVTARDEWLEAEKEARFWIIGFINSGLPLDKDRWIDLSQKLTDSLSRLHREAERYILSRPT